MRSVATAIVLTLLSGCHTAITSRSATDEGTRSTHALREEPHRAAVCIARNIDRQANALTAHIRAGVAPVLVEVQVRADQIVSLAQLLVAEDGSTAVLWTTRDPRYPRDELVSAMISGW